MDNQTLIDTLSKHPLLRKRIEAMLGVVEDSSGTVELADTAEERLIEGGRHLNKEALQSWSDNQAAKQASRFEARHKNMHKAGKKNCTGTAPLETFK